LISALIASITWLTGNPADRAGRAATKKAKDAAEMTIADGADAGLLRKATAPPLARPSSTKLSAVFAQ
jgi:hypothetical protein